MVKPIKGTTAMASRYCPAYMHHKRGVVVKVGAKPSAGYDASDGFCNAAANISEPLNGWFGGSTAKLFKRTRHVSCVGPPPPPGSPMLGGMSRSFLAQCFGGDACLLQHLHT